MLFGYTNLRAAPEVDADLHGLRSIGCDQIVIESGFGPGGSRPMFNRLVTSLGSGDAIALWDLDRIACSAREAMTLVVALFRKGTGLRVLSQDLNLDGSSASETACLLQSLLRMNERTTAPARGERRGPGRPRALLPQDAPRVEALMQQHRADVPAVAVALGVSVATVYRFLRSRRIEARNAGGEGSAR